MNIVAIVVIIYLLVTVAIGAVVKKRNLSLMSYFGGNLNLLMCVAVGAGEWMGGTSTTGVSEYGYLYGISGAWYTLANGIGIFILGLCFVKLFYRSGALTVSGIVGKHIGPKAQSAASILTLISLFLVGTSQMLALGTLGESLLGLNKVASILVVGIIVVAYTSLGGMDMIGKTNLLHIMILYLGMVIACVIKVGSVGGVNGLFDKLPQSFFSVTSIGKAKVGAWVVSSILGACTAQAGLQPVLSAKNEKVARMACFVIAMIVAPFGILTATLGMVARVYYPNLDNAKAALPLLLLDLNPVLSVVIIVAVFSAVFSTAAPIILSCSTIMSREVLPKVGFNNKAIKIEVFNKIVTFGCGIGCVFLAICFLFKSTILDIVYFAYGIRGSLFIILLFGIYWKKYSEKNAVIAMVLTSVMSLVWIVYKHFFGMYPINPYFSEIYAAVLTAILSSVIMGLYEGKRR